jgi:hypothetical protein
VNASNRGLDKIWTTKFGSHCRDDGRSIYKNRVLNHKVGQFIICPLWVDKSVWCSNFLAWLWSLSERTTARSTLVDAPDLRDWRNYHALALRLIQRARSLYAKGALNIGLDTATIDLCLSLFDWAPFRTSKAHSLVDLRGAIPAFIHIRDGKKHEVNGHPACRGRGLQPGGSRLLGLRSAA